MSLSPLNLSKVAPYTPTKDEDVISDLSSRSTSPRDANVLFTPEGNQYKTTIPIDSMNVPENRPRTPDTPPPGFIVFPITIEPSSPEQHTTATTTSSTSEPTTQHACRCLKNIASVWWNLLNNPRQPQTP